MFVPSFEKLRSPLFCGFLTLGLSGVGCAVYSDGLLNPSGGAGGDGTAGASADLGGGAGLIDSGSGGSTAGNGGGDSAGNDNAGNDNAGGAGAGYAGSSGASQGGTGGVAGGAGEGGAGGKERAGGSAGSVGHAGAGGALASGGSGGHAGATASGGTSGSAGSGAGGAPAGGAPAGGAPAGGAPAGGAPAGGAPAGGAPAGGAGSGVLCSDHPLTPMSSWVPSASHHQSTSPATNLTDGTSARWSTGKPQAGDEWLQVDFGATVNLRSINLQQGTIDANDYPRSYAVIVSNTALDSNGTVRASGVGTGGVTTIINLPSVTSGRYLLIKQLGTSLSWWSVEELEVSCSD